MTGPQASHATIGPDLSVLPGVPRWAGPIGCPDCDARAATVHHAPAPAVLGTYSVTLACAACGAIFELNGTAYAAGLAAGVLIERARAAAAEPAPEPCPECGSLLAYSHDDGCSRGAR